MMKHISRQRKALLAAFICILFSATLSAQRYQVGDIVQNFTLTNRATNEAVSLSDFEGKVVFLEWFAYWCPFCRAAADQVGKGIVDYYGNSGNANGIPVLHVALNLEPDNPAATDKFIRDFGIQLVLNDTNATLANRFQSSGQPIFAIINGVEGSSSHQQWELIYSRNGYLENNHPIGDFRQAIDSVKIASITAPAITQDPTDQVLASGTEFSLSVEASGDGLSYVWRRGDTTLEGQTGSSLTIVNATQADSGSYTVTVSNSGGEVTSAAAEVTVKLSLADYLVAAGLNGEHAQFAADPDLDGFSNVFEYLAQTDPDDPYSSPASNLTLSVLEQELVLAASFTIHVDAIGYAVRVETSSDPSFSIDTSVMHTFDESGEIEKALNVPESIFARMVANPI